MQSLLCSERAKEEEMIRNETNEKKMKMFPNLVTLLPCSAVAFVCSTWKLSWEGFVQWSERPYAVPNQNLYIHNGGAYRKYQNRYSIFSKFVFFFFFFWFFFLWLCMLLLLFVAFQSTIDATWNWDKSSLCSSYPLLICHAHVERVFSNQRFFFGKIDDIPSYTAHTSVLVSLPLSLPAVSKSTKSHFRKIAFCFRFFFFFLLNILHPKELYFLVRCRITMTGHSQCALFCDNVTCDRPTTTTFQSQAKTMWLTDNRLENYTHNFCFDLLARVRRAYLHLASILFGWRQRPNTRSQLTHTINCDHNEVKNGWWNGRNAYLCVHFSLTSAKW